MSPALAAPRPLSVVIVDDTPDLRDLMRIAFTRGGYDVVGEAGDGRTGIEVIRTHRPDVVLLDLAMPVMDGIEALPSIRRLCPGAKVVVLSGFGAQHMAARAVESGADGYVQKGAPLSTILAYVADLTGGERSSSRSLSVVPATPGAGTPGVPHADKLDGTEPPAAAPAGAAAPAPAGAAAASPTLAPLVQRGAADTPGNVSTVEALRSAPYGVLELADEPLFRIVHANPTAVRLLGSVGVDGADGAGGSGAAGTPLAMLAPALASLVAYHRMDADASFETEVEGGRVRASLRRTGWSVLVYLDSSVEDVGMLRRAIATTAHEVRGPVAVLCGIAETLAYDDDIAVDHTRRLMDSVARQARILDQVTADLLTAAQIQRGTLSVERQVVEPRALVLGTIEGRWDIEVELSDDRPVHADPLRLEQMLTNLLSNAHKYGRAPHVVRVRPEGRFVCFDVIDHGDGVPEEFRGSLFREFARARGAVATGTGLGLYVVRTLALAQDGEVAYAPGEQGGSVFTIKLPAC